MKIPLHFGQIGTQSAVTTQAKVIERDVLAAQQGDWNAKASLIRAMTPLLVSLAQKRATDQPNVNALVEAGKEGLYRATRKYRHAIGAERFQIFALDFIEAAMDDHLKGGNWFTRLFQRR
jgi:DNA-directed RNA polymerase specialized sigma subunit